MLNNHYILDTIIAIATPPGQGGIGIIRISGHLVPKIIKKVLGKQIEPRQAKYLSFLAQDGSSLDKVIAIFFSKPHSFTGENILEIHGHGGNIILDVLIEQILKISDEIRLAHPGEFTERAFLNGKIDLIQAEAIADVINATSQQAAKSASNSLKGVFSNKIHIILKKIIKLRTYVESTIDFSEEEIQNISWDEIKENLKTIIEDATKIYQSAKYGFLLKEGLNIVIAGAPNAGKSSLFNKLINMDRAIVSKISGTTRDTLQESIQINGINLYITDTAGIKNNNHCCEIEKIGIQRTWDQLNHADHILWVVDSNEHINKNYHSMLNAIKNVYFKNRSKNIPITIIRNKSDLNSETAKIETIEQYTCITLSALLNQGINILKTHLKNNVIYSKINNNLLNHKIIDNQSNFIARRRHLNALKKSLQHLLSAQNQLKSKKNYHHTMIINDLFAEDIKLAQYELNNIIGTFTSDDLLKKIFSKFCIGK